MLPDRDDHITARLTDDAHRKAENEYSVALGEGQGPHRGAVSVEAVAVEVCELHSRICKDLVKERDDRNVNRWVRVKTQSFKSSWNSRAGSLPVGLNRSWTVSRPSRTCRLRYEEAVKHNLVVDVPLDDMTIQEPRGNPYRRARAPQSADRNHGIEPVRGQKSHGYYYTAISAYLRRRNSKRLTSRTR